MTSTTREHTLRQTAAHRWEERNRFADKRSWLWSTYNRLLLRQCPLLGRVRVVRLPLGGHGVRVRPIGGG
ncbi:MAG: hypothetical protein M3198_19645, partial [Actinomycetota bacterium]|nr:hypothetical protein [Actinomycetota bacterium]